ncbi:transglycosylase SLT domain-containing protein, partial [Patescibacteria group bacterium]
MEKIDNPEITVEEEHTSEIKRRTVLQVGVASAVASLIGCNSDKIPPTRELGKPVPPPRPSSGPKRPKPAPKPVEKIKIHAEAKDIVGAATFDSGSFDKFADMFGTIFSSKFGIAHYFTTNGEICSSKALPKKGHEVQLGNEVGAAPETWELGGSSTFWTSDIKQLWHNTNRYNCKPKEGVVLPTDSERVGYPFVSVPNSSDPDVSGSTMKEVVEKRLENKHRDKRYFKGEAKTMSQAIAIIAKEYGIPADVVLAIGAQESNFYKFRKSNQGAKGVFQLMDGKRASAETGLDETFEKTSFR